MARSRRVAAGLAVVVALGGGCTRSDLTTAAPASPGGSTREAAPPTALRTETSESEIATSAKDSANTRASEARDVKAIRGVYKRHRRAVIAHDGDEAAATVSRPTLQYYEHLRREALTAGPGELAGLDITDQLSVGLIRATVPPRDLVRMDGELLFSIIVDIGLFDQGGTTSHMLDTIKLTGDVATAKTTSRGERSYTLFDFRREDGVWKFEPISTLATDSLYITRDRQKRGMTEEEYVLDAVRANTGEKHDRALFRAPNIDVDLESDA